MNDELHGWHPDPFGRFEERYFIDGAPSRLVRTGGIESSDPHELPAMVAKVLATRAQHSTRTNGFAVASLVLGLVTAGVGSILALVFGYHARSQIRESEGEQSGDGMAITGIIFGWLGLATAVILVVVLVAHAQHDASIIWFGVLAVVFMLLAGFAMSAEALRPTDPKVDDDGYERQPFWTAVKQMTSDSIHNRNYDPSLHRRPRR